MQSASRVERLRQSLAQKRLDALLVTHLPNVRYLCGFTGSAGVLLIAAAEAAFFTDGRYAQQARAEVRGAKVIIARNSPLAAVGEWLAKRGKKLHIKTLGIEAEHLTVAERSRLAKNMPAAMRTRQTAALVEQFRMVKDADEMARLRAAIRLAGGLFDRLLEVIRPGAKEIEVAAELEYAARREGAEAMSFETIIASGKRSALPHGRASNAALPPAGFVVCDFGVILAGYCSDMTRTVYLGRPTPAARMLYDTVRAAQEAAVESVGPGVSVGEVDRAARKLLKKKGLARYFTHSTGHGVGLEIHEAPRVAAGQKTILEPGMVVTIEPGIYIPGKWGIRIEDMVAVTERGYEILTPTTKEFVII